MKSHRAIVLLFFVVHQLVALGECAGESLPTKHPSDLDFHFAHDTIGKFKWLITFH